jgi:hypothetical protein
MCFSILEFLYTVKNCSTKGKLSRHFTGNKLYSECSSNNFKMYHFGKNSKKGKQQRRFGHKRHLPDILETHIRNSMPEDVGIDRVVCLDCTNCCHHAPSLHIGLETHDISEELISDLSLLVEAI